MLSPAHQPTEGGEECWGSKPVSAGAQGTRPILRSSFFTSSTTLSPPPLPVRVFIVAQSGWRIKALRPMISPVVDQAELCYECE
ncbi:unnamed protein product [Arctogadus glacialis]